MIAVNFGARTRMTYRMIVNRGHRGEKICFRECDFAHLVDATHQQLRGPIVLMMHQ